MESNVKTSSTAVLARISNYGMVLAAGFAVTTALAGPVAADEAWETDIGHLYWADTLGPTMVLAYPDGKMFIEELGIADTRPGTYYGYWQDYNPGADEDLCEVANHDHYGIASFDWGQVEITFTNASFPFNFTARASDCNGPFVYTFTGTPN